MRMKMSSERNARPPVSRARAWSYLLINVLVCPGLGSALAKRWGGLPQLALAFGGAIWMTVPLGQFFMEWAQHWELRPEWQSYFKAGLGGVVCFLLGWLWSILTSIAVLREVPKDNDPLLAELPPRTSGP
jgi:hypothetical protein